MIRVTERAASELSDILAASQAQKDQAVRLLPDDSGNIAMTIDRPSQGDEVVSGEKRPLLILDAALAARLADVVLDLTPANGRPPHFVFRRHDDPL
jgi:hypothetical protein